MAWQPGASVRTPRAYAAHRRYGSPVGGSPTAHDLDTSNNSVGGGGGGVGGFGSGDDDLFTMPDVPQLRSISPVRGLRTRSPPSHLPSSFSQRTEPHLRHQASRSVPWQPTPSQPPSSPQMPAPAPAEDDSGATPAATTFDTAEEDVEEWEAKVKAAMGRLQAQRRSGLLVAAAPPRMSTDEALSNAHPSVPVFALAAPDPAALSLPAPPSSTRASELATPAKAAAGDAASPPVPSTAGRTDGAAAAEAPVDRSSVPSMVSMAQRLPGPPPASRASSRTSGRSVGRDESGVTEAAAAAAAAAKDLPSTASSVCTDDAAYKRQVHASTSSLRDTLSQLQSELLTAAAAESAQSAATAAAAATTTTTTAAGTRTTLGTTTAAESDSQAPRPSSMSASLRQRPSGVPTGSVSARSVCTQPAGDGAGTEADADASEQPQSKDACPYFRRLNDREGEIMNLRLPTTWDDLPVDRHSAPTVTHRVQWPVKEDNTANQKKWGCTMHKKEFTKYCIETCCNMMVCDDCANTIHVGHTTVAIPTDEEMTKTLKDLQADTPELEAELLHAPSLMRNSFRTRRLQQTGASAAEGEVVSAVYRPPAGLDCIEESTDAAFAQLDTRLDYLSGKLHATESTWRTCRRRVKPDKAYNPPPKQNAPLYGRGLTAVSNEHRHLLSKVPTID